MARKLTFDRYLIAATFGLIFYGLLMVYSASATISMDLYGSSYIFLGKQALGLVIGLVCMIVAMNCDYRKWRNPTFVFSFLFVCQILLVAVFFLTVRITLTAGSSWACFHFSPRKCPSSPSSFSSPTFWRAVFIR